MIFPLLTGPAWKSDPEGQCHREPGPQSVGVRGDLLRALPGRRREVHRSDQFADETRAEWYLRQMLGSANFQAGPVMAFMSGNLCYQIEHHLFPDLPSNRYPEIAEQVRAAVRQIRPALHHRFARQAVPAGVPHHPQARAAGRSCGPPPTTPRKPLPSGNSPCWRRPRRPFPAGRCSASIRSPDAGRDCVRRCRGECRIAGKARQEKEALREAKVVLQEKARAEKQVLRRRALREGATVRYRLRQRRKRLTYSQM